MKNEFIPYEQALALKELGFDEPCFGYYVSFADNKEIPFKLIQIQSEKEQFKWVDNVCHAPTFSQSFRWFRDKYGLISYIHPLALLQDTKKWCYEITDFSNNWDESFNLHSPEEAELECLIRLIEMAKNK
jgi:hypothetical protein